MTRLFKPGDRVRLKSGGPVMEVIKYIETKELIAGYAVSNSKVLCVLYSKNEGRTKRVFHQYRLSKVRGVIKYDHHLASNKLRPNN